MPHERSWASFFSVFVAFALLFAIVESSRLPARLTAPMAVSSSAAQVAPIDSLVQSAIARGELPGCMVVVGRSDGVTFRRAYGRRSLRPARSDMQETALFDLASLTKPVATAGTIMVLSDLGLIDLDAPVSAWIPSFTGDKSSITTRMLLTHTAGLPAASPQSDYDHGIDDAVSHIVALPLIAKPDTRYLYSDLGYIVLGAIAARATGHDLSTLSHDAVFSPLGLVNTGFSPGPAACARAVPTEARNGSWLQGAVHDPRAARLGGVAGHAGLFSTADDLARFARALLNGGELDGVRVWSDSTVDEMLRPQGVVGHRRALGWDVVRVWDASAGRTRETLGHGGFTGTYLWLDRERDVFVVFLSSRLHPAGRGNVQALVAQIRGAVLASTPTRAAHVQPAVRAGIDVLRAGGFQSLRGTRVGLVTHAAAITHDGVRTVDVLHAAPGVNLVALFTPEHGLEAKTDRAVADGRDPRTGLPIHSLYGPRRTPTAAQLAGVDTIVVDLQDAGVRFYTYFATLRNVMQAAARDHKKLVVLDRPNPLGGEVVEGPLPDAGADAFLHPYPVPIRHGMTLGELALLLDRETNLGVHPEVVRAQGWRRSMLFADTGLSWTPPSPNLTSPTAALLYLGVALVEMTNVSVGRGTDEPFEVVGAPWADARLAARLSELGILGVAFEDVVFTPSSGPYAGRRCQGARLRITDARALRAMPLGLGIAAALRGLYGRQWDDRGLAVLLPSRELVDGLRSGRSLPALQVISDRNTAAFLERRSAVLQYR